MEAPPWFVAEWCNCGIRSARAINVIQYAPSQRRVSRLREDWLLVVVARGSIHLRQFERSLPLVAGDAAVLLPNFTFDGREATEEVPAEVLVVQFNVVAPPPARNDPLTRLGLPAVVSLRDQAWESAAQSLAACALSRGNRLTPARILANGWLGLLIAWYIDGGFRQDAFEPSLAGPVPPWLSELRRVLDFEALRRTTTVSSLARRFGYCREHMARMFHRHFGTSVGQFILQRRMVQAARFLRSNPEMKIAEIARRCGYTSRSLFNRHFRRELGTPPTEWRQPREHERGRCSRVDDLITP